MLRRSGWTLLLAGYLISPVPAIAQESTSTLNVYLDCQTFFCDFDHFRREITFVNWMRDQRDAEVHVLITAQQTGGGGWELTLAFIGRGQFAGQEDTLQYTSANTDTEAEVRDGLTQSISLGLVRYVAQTPIGRRLEIRLPEEAAEQAQQAGPEDDPWNFWTFEASVGGSLNGERQLRFYSLNGSLEANRVTEDLKVELSLDGNTFRREFNIIPELDSTIVSTRESWMSRGTLVFSMGSHWSLGARGSVGASTFFNQDLAVRLGPAVEFDIYPYAESTRRQIVAQYWAGVAAFDYRELTIFDRTSEVRPLHTLTVGAEITQPWGSVDAAFFGSQYLHDLSKHTVGISGEIELRVVRGLSFRTFGSVSRVKDELNISSVGLTPEEILLSQRQLGTDYRYFAFFSLSYTFGSKFANVVNPRMDDSFFF
jgi:hypothetical protein